MKEMNLARFDLNLLVVFEVLMQERHVGRAGDRLHLTQPAVSHALRRLRGLVNDPLFVKHARGIRPTPRAESLASSLAPVLASLRGSLSRGDEFTPAAATRSVVIGASDYIELVLIPSVMARLRRQAPSLDLGVKAITRASVTAELRRREIDLAIGPLSASPDAVQATPLFTERFVLVARKGHPVLKGSLTAKRFAGYPHLLVSPQGDSSGVVDQALRELGLRRRTALTVAHFLCAPWIIADTDLVTALPERIARRLLGPAACGMRELPLKIPSYTVGLVQSKDSLGDPLLSWLTTVIREVAADG